MEFWRQIIIAIHPIGCSLWLEYERIEFTNYHLLEISFPWCTGFGVDVRPDLRSCLARREAADGALGVILAVSAFDVLSGGRIISTSCQSLFLTFNPMDGADGMVQRHCGARGIWLLDGDEVFLSSIWSSYFDILVIAKQGAFALHLLCNAILERDMSRPRCRTAEPTNMVDEIASLIL